MTRLVLDVPTEKIRTLRRMLQRMGIDAHILHGYSERKSLLRKRTVTHPSLHKIATSFILFDWEFFSNELEYE
jgi:hypothetical protein